MIIYNIISSLLASLSAFVGKFGSTYLSNGEYIYGILLIIVSVVLSSQMIILFYKSVRIIGTAKATCLNYAFNTCFTVRHKFIKDFF